MLSTLSIKDLTRNAVVKFQKSLENKLPVMRSSGLFAVGTWDANTGDTKEYSEIDKETYAGTIGEGGNGRQQLVQQGYSKTVSPKVVGLDQEITWEINRRNKYIPILNELINLAPACTNRLELDLSHRIGFGTATSYTDKDGATIDLTTGDGYQLFYSAHTLRGTTTTYRNILASNPRYSSGAQELIEELAVGETLDQFGVPKDAMFDVIFSTDNPTTVNSIRRELRSTAAVDAPNAGVTNVNQGKYRHIIMPRIDTDANGVKDSTKKYMWGIASTELAQNSSFLDIEQEPTLYTPNIENGGDGSNSSRALNYFARMSYSICIPGARWIKVSLGTGAA